MMVTLAEKLRLERRRRIEKFIGVLEAHKGENVSKAISWFCLNEGIREEKAKEYLRILVQAGIINLENGIIKEVNRNNLLF